MDEYFLTEQDIQIIQDDVEFKVFCIYCSGRRVESDSVRDKTIQSLFGPSS
jgi:hypothetical protein